MKPLAASFRDSSGHIYSSDGRILRVVTPTGLDYFSRTHGLLRQMVTEGRLVDFSEVNAERLDFEHNIGVVLEHPRLDLLSMPYEWSFSLLKAAARFHILTCWNRASFCQMPRPTMYNLSACAQSSSITYPFGPKAMVSFGRSIGNSASNFSTRSCFELFRHRPQRLVSGKSGRNSAV